jgi:hypothetical protein
LRGLMLNSEHVSAVPLVARPAGRPGGIGAGRREWPGPICCGPFIAGPRARADAGARHGVRVTIRLIMRKSRYFGANAPRPGRKRIATTAYRDLGKFA